MLGCWVPVDADVLFFCSLQLVLPEYLIHFFFCVMFFCAAEWLTLSLNIPLLAYHVWRWVSDFCLAEELFNEQTEKKIGSGVTSPCLVFGRQKRLCLKSQCHIEVSTKHRSISIHRSKLWHRCQLSIIQRLVMQWSYLPVSVSFRCPVGTRTAQTNIFRSANSHKNAVFYITFFPPKW